MDVLIVGGGGYGRSVADAILLGGDDRLVGFLDDVWPDVKDVLGYPVLGKVSTLEGLGEHAGSAIVAISNNAIREHLQVRILAAGFELATVVQRPSCRHVLSWGRLRGHGRGGCRDGGATRARGNRELQCCGGSPLRRGSFRARGRECLHGWGAVLARGAWMQAGAALEYGVTVPAGAVLVPGESRT